MRFCGSSSEASWQRSLWRGSGLWSGLLGWSKWHGGSPEKKQATWKDFIFNSNEFIIIWGVFAVRCNMNSTIYTMYCLLNRLISCFNWELPSKPPSLLPLFFLTGQRMLYENRTNCNFTRAGWSRSFLYYIYLLQKESFV